MEIMHRPYLSSLSTYHIQNRSEPCLFRLKPEEEKKFYFRAFGSMEEGNELKTQSKAQLIDISSDDDRSVSQTSPPVPSIKIEPPCEIIDEEASQSSTITNTNNLSPNSMNSRAASPSGNHPGNYKKNLTARFLQQGKSEDDSYYRSEADFQPDQKRSRSLDRGLDHDENEPETQPLDLSAPQNDLRSRFEARARKMHRRNRPDSAENGKEINQAIQNPSLLAMQRLSHSDFQINRQRGSLSSQSFTSSYETTDEAPSSESHDRDPAALGRFGVNMPLPPISLMYNRAPSSSSTDGSLELADKAPPAPFSRFMPGFPLGNLFGTQFGELPLGSLPQTAAFNPAFAAQSINSMQTFFDLQNRLANQTTTNQCRICKQTFGSLDNLAKHEAKHLPTEVKTDNNNRVHMCKVCDRSFSRSDMLTRHMRLHTGHKPYECKVCGQVFSRSDHLNTHKRTHTGEKPYMCPKCPYAACRRDMITRHMRIHTNKETNKRRKRMGMFHMKDSASGSSVESSDSMPSRGSMSGNSFDSSFEASDFRWSQRQLLDPADLVRSGASHRSWSAPNSIDLSDAVRRRGAWSSMNSTDSEPQPNMSFDSAEPPTTVAHNSPTSLSVDRLQKSKRPSLVRQDASLDDESAHPSHSSPVPSAPSQTLIDSKRLYRSSGDGRSIDDNSSVASFDKDSLLDSPRLNETPSPHPAASPKSQKLTTPHLPKQASLSDELNLQKCILDG